MAWNVPNDWGCYYAKCSYCGTKYHMSEGGCDCSERRSDSARRPWLEDSGYELSDNGDWQRMLSSRTHTARKAHCVGTAWGPRQVLVPPCDREIKPGQRYRVTVWKSICDDTGKTTYSTSKRLVG